MTDKIVIKDLKVFGYHGVDRSERDHGQTFVTNLEIGLDLKDAAEADLLGRTLDYGAVVKEVERIVSQERYTLLEALAQRIADSVLERPQVERVLVKVTKPGSPIESDVGSVGVEIIRSKV